MRPVARGPVRDSGTSWCVFLLGARRRLRPDALAEIDVGPAHAQHLTAPRAGQQQQPDGVGRLPVRVLGQRLHQPPQFVAGEYRRRWCSMLRSMPLHGLVSRMPQRTARENIFDIIATDRLARVRRAAPRDLPVQRVDVGEGDVGDLGMRPEVRSDVLREHAAVVVARCARRLRGRCSCSNRSISSATVGAARSASISASGSPPASTSRRSSRALARAAAVCPVMETGRWCRSGRGRPACSSRSTNDRAPLAVTRTANPPTSVSRVTV